MNFVFLFIPPTPILAQAPSKVSARLTLPVGPHTNLVIEKNDATESQQVIVSGLLSTTKLRIAANGSTAEAAPYYPYGGAVNKNTTAINPNNRYYTGQRKVTDDDTLYNYNARYYSPETGVFTQPDQVEGPNRFAYVNGNPIMASDPSGFMSTDSRGPTFQGPSEGLMLMSGSESNRLPVPGNPLAYTDQIWELEKEAAVKDMVITAVGAPVGAAIGYFGGPSILAAGTACAAALGPCLMGIGDGIMMATGASTIPSFISPLMGLKGVGSEFIKDESGQFMPLLGKGVAEVPEVADEIVRVWASPTMTRLKAPSEFRKDLVGMIKSETPGLIYADSGRPVVLSKDALRIISKRFGKGIRDERLMQDFADSIYQLSQDPAHHALKTHKIDAYNFISSKFNGDWRVGWDWVRMKVKTSSGALQDVSAIKLYEVGQHDGANAIYR